MDPALLYSENLFHFIHLSSKPILLPKLINMIRHIVWIKTNSSVWELSKLSVEHKMSYFNDFFLWQGQHVKQSSPFQRVSFHLSDMTYILSRMPSLTILTTFSVMIDTLPSLVAQLRSIWSASVMTLQFHFIMRAVLCYYIQNRTNIYILTLIYIGKTWSSVSCPVVHLGMLCALFDSKCILRKINVTKLL